MLLPFSFYFPPYKPIVFVFRHYIFRRIVKHFFAIRAYNISFLAEKPWHHDLVSAYRAYKISVFVHGLFSFPVQRYPIFEIAYKFIPTIFLIFSNVDTVHKNILCNLWYNYLYRNNLILVYPLIFLCYVRNYSNNESSDYLLNIFSFYSLSLDFLSSKYVTPRA